MKQKGFKLWIIVFMLIIVSGGGLASSMMNIELEPTTFETDSPGYGDTIIKEVDDETLDIIKELQNSFHHFITIASDFVGTVFSGNESKYDNIIDALHSDITDNSEKITSEEPQIPQREQLATAGVMTSCEVVRVVDGDTFIANIGGQEEKIRLIGIDTPESVHSDKTRNTIWGQYASDYTKTILSEGQTVYLEYDVQAKDIYDRTLAYVWLSEDMSNIENMLNAMLVADGYAMDKVFEPNSKYAENFKNLRQTAQQNGTGLWADEGFADLWEG